MRTSPSRAPETVDAGEAAVAAREAVTPAEQDLADAQATLAAAEASDGPVDVQWAHELTAALEEFQTDSASS